ATATPATSVYRPLDETFAQSVTASGMQGQTLLAGGEDVEDQSLLTWEETRNGKRVLHLQGKLRDEAGEKLKKTLLTSPASRSWERSPAKRAPGAHLGHKRIPSCTYFNIALSPAVGVLYVPGEKHYDNPYSAQGLFHLTLSDYGGSPEEIQRALSLAGERLGLDFRLSTEEDLEYLYLRKMIWARNLESDEFKDHLSSDLTVRQKRDLCKQYLEQKLGVTDLRALSDYDWRPRFDSAYRSQGDIREAGWPHWNRFDAREHIADCLKNYHIGAFLSINERDKGDAIARIVRESGSLLSTEERWDRLGIYTQGLSSEKDRHKGGASYVFSRLTRNRDLYTFVFSKDLLSRADHIVYPHGIYGDTHPETMKRKLNMADYSSAPSYEFMTKHGISFLDYLETINVNDSKDREKVLRAFAEAGISQIRGIPVEKIVQVQNKPLWMRLVAPLFAQHRGESGSAEKTVIPQGTPNSMPAARSGFAPIQGNSVMPLLSVPETQSEVMGLIASAQKTLDLTMYHFMKAEWSEPLRKAAIRGVKVRLLLDPMWRKEASREDRDRFTLLKSAGLEIREFQSRSILGEARAYNHAKLLIADGEKAVLGGTNWASSVTNEDLNVLVAGPVLADLATFFDADWNASGDNREQEMNPLREERSPMAKGAATMEVISPTPGGPERKETILREIRQAKEKIRVSQFIFDDDDIVNALQEASEAGVDVKVLLDGSDKSAGGLRLKFQGREHTLRLPIVRNRTSCHKLTAGGVDARLFDSSANPDMILHTKFAVFDEGTILMGSTDWYKRGFFTNRELLVRIEDPETARTLENYFDHLYYRNNSRAEDAGLRA
ncbi:MAG: phosphatidylserine/phosphatidylglycerophosphate/cardiolipin synthase family protein, partial [Armatimonadetes bacterium]|nr:phosphatidylserine/phosphatidylglycerophosphate/cardiolipin synthase family protein [Armatimonadota bacterium]